MQTTPIAILALTAFPIAAILIFALRPFSKAVLWTILFAQLALPVGAFIKFEQIPQFDKATIPNLCIFAAALLSGRLRLSRPPTQWGWFGVLVVMFLVGPAITSPLNGDTLKYGARILPGVGLYDAGSAFILAAITIIPLFIGRAILTEEDDNWQILRVITLAMLFYSIPLLIEIRLSPQLHYWVYGYYPSQFIQSVREGGFRPMAFMGHGLIAANFCVQGFLASVAFWRLRTMKLPTPSRGLENHPLVSPYLAAVLLICRSLGVIIYGAILAPIIFLARPVVQMRICVLMVSFALLYPSLRYFDLVPTSSLVGIARMWSPDRAQSLEFRFSNENLLLHRAAERPFFGWGRFGRNRVYDTESGADLAIPDGEWVIALGQFGVIGFIAEFGLLSLAVFRAGLAFRHAQSEKERLLLSTLAVLVSVSIFDLLPNGFLLPWTWLLAGALLGRSDTIMKRGIAESLLPIAKYHVQRKPASTGSVAAVRNGALNSKL